MKVCSRCGFFYPKTQQSCHHCSGMSDEEVLRNLARKKHFRLSLGRAMFLGAVFILVVMILLNA